MSLSKHVPLYSRTSSADSSENSLNFDSMELKLELEMDVHNAEKTIATSKLTEESRDDCEDVICKLLQVDISSINYGEKKKLFDRLEIDLSTCRKYVTQTNLIPSYIVRRNSRGLPLRGTFICGQETTESKEFIVQVKNELRLSVPSAVETIETCRFFTKLELNKFKRKLKIETLAEVNAFEKETFFAVLSVYQISHAIWEPNLQDLRLSNSVSENLKDMEKFLFTGKEQEAKKLCRKVFEVFGSHFYTGRYFYGGLYVIETIYESDNCIDKEKAYAYIENLHKMKKSEVFFKESVSHQGENSDVLIDTEKYHIDVRQSCTAVGGPQDVSIFPLWKRILNSNNRTWEVVQKGESTIGHYVGIWVLVHLHRTSFKNSVRLSSFLSQEWEIQFGTPQNDLALELIKRGCDTMTFDFHTQSPKSNLFLSKSLCTHLREVQDLVGKSNIYNKHLKSCKKISSFLERMMKTEYDNAHILPFLQSAFFLLKEAADGIENTVLEATRKWLKNNMWPGRNILEIESTESVEQWINFLNGDYEKYLELLVEEEQIENFSVETLAKALTSELERSIQKLLYNLSKKNEHTQYLCLVAMLIPLGFDLHDRKFHSSVYLPALREFNIYASRKLLTYKQYQLRGTIQCQAAMIRMIIYGILKYGRKKQGQSDYEEFSEVKQTIQRDIKLSPEIKEIIGRSNALLEITQTLSEMTGAFWTFFELERHFPDNILPKDITFPNRDDDMNAVPTHMSFLLREMCISQFFPGKMSLHIVLQLRDDIFNEPSDMSDFPWILLRKIIAINSDFREKLLDDLLRKLNKEKKETGIQLHTRGKLRKLPLIKTNNNSKPLLDYHPLDVFFSLFNCFDPFLKKLIVQKMTVCHFAIPFIYPHCKEDTMVASVWPLREIFLGGSSEAVTSLYLKTVAFIRIGQHLRSKSQLINKLIRGQNDEHSTFFHKDCPLGQNPRKLYNGVVEISWFFPSNNTAKESIEKTADEQETAKSLPCPLTILNLRGDAYDFKEQTKAILSISNIVVLFIKADCLIQTQYKSILFEISKKNIPVIIVTQLPKDEDLIEKVVGAIKSVGIGADLNKILSLSESERELNISEIKQLLTEEISESILQTDRCTCIEEAVYGLPKGIRVDEESPACLRGKLYSEKVFSLIENEQNNFGESDIKSHIVPLQAEDLWQEWSKKQKEIRRSGKKENTNLQLLKMKNIRIEQTEQCNIACDAIAMFAEVLSRETDDETTQYFLVFFKQKMDHQSRHVLPKLNQELYTAFKKYQQDKSKSKEKRDDKNMRENEECLMRAETKLAKASFGLEHFFRELGQVYESFMYSKEDTRCEVYDKTTEFICGLPKHAARVLLLGQPLEIMDGDAANVPLKWIDAVLLELENEVGSDKKVFAISVLGIQSSGKSTLLNTMFGLQFAVNAGRCTRGIFMQLVKVDQHNSALPFNYAMVIDTEGLRAPELSGQKVHHDNELATLVIGIGDVSIINIKGETIAEMADVIQIVVHALLRLMQANEIKTSPGENMLNLTQSSVFVHQNVSAQNANKQMLQGNQKTIQCLDEMTKEVADDEHMEHITAFQDVINFDPLKHVKYIPDLWHGSPPMASASPEYSMKVQEVTKCILRDIAVEQKYVTSIHDTRAHIRNLWEGILNENFVFSFRNVLEVKAFGTLENKFQRLVRQLENLKLNWFEYKIKPTLAKCTDVKDIEEYATALLNTFIRELNMLTTVVTDDLEKFVQYAQLKDHMIHWKDRKLAEIEMISNSISKDISKKIEMQKDLHKTRLKSRDDLRTLKKEMNEKAIECAKQFKDRMISKSVIIYEFQKLWSGWIDELAPDITKKEMDEKKARIQAEMIGIIYDKLQKHDYLVTSGLDEKSIQNGDDNACLFGSLPRNRIMPEYISRKGRLQKGYQFARHVGDFFGINEENFQLQAHTKLNDLFNRIDYLLKKIEKNEEEYEKSQFSNILNVMQEFFTEHNSNRKIFGYPMTPPLQVMVALHISRHSYRKFCKVSDKYTRKHSLRAQINEHKQEVQTLFVGLCTVKANALLVTHIICAELRHLILERTERELAVIIPDKIYNRIGLTKWNLIAKIMEDLACKMNFNKYMEYIKATENFVLHWITSYTNDYMNSIESGSDTVYMKCVSVFIPVVLQQIKEATKAASDTNPKSMQEWIKAFKDKEKSNLMLSHTFESLKYIKIDDFKYLATSINARLVEEEDAIKRYCYKRSLEDIKWRGNSVYKTIVNALWGCKTTCPWCAEPCISTRESNIHRCIQHRPQGIVGITCTADGTLVCNTCTYEVRDESTSHQQCGSWCGCSDSNCKTSHKCKDYKTYMKEWEIKPSFDMSKSTYWAWFMWTFRTDLARYYSAKIPNFPSGWDRISKETAIKSLEHYSS